MINNNMRQDSNLLTLKHYCAVTFPNTHSALQAEKLLQKLSRFPFVVMPVPRIISSGCGLSVKTTVQCREKLIEYLAEGGISIEGVYILDKELGSVARIV